MNKIKYECSKCGDIYEKFGPPPKPREPYECSVDENGCHDWDFSPSNEEELNSYWEGYEPEE